MRVEYLNCVLYILYICIHIEAYTGGKVQPMKIKLLFFNLFNGFVLC